MISNKRQNQYALSLSLSLSLSTLSLTTYYKIWEVGDRLFTLQNYNTATPWREKRVTFDRRQKWLYAVTLTDYTGPRNISIPGFFW